MSENQPNRLEVMVNESGLGPIKARTMLEEFQDHVSMAEEWEQRAKEIVVTSADDIMQINAARTGRLFLREKWKQIEETRKRLKADAVREGKAIDGISNFLKGMIEPIEEYLKSQENFVKIKEEAERLAKEKEQAEKEERERLEKEEADRQEQERIRLENEKQKLELEAREKELAEQRAVIAKQQQEADRLEREGQERERLERAAKQEADAKLAEETRLREKAEKELEAKPEPKPEPSPTGDAVIALKWAAAFVRNEGLEESKTVDLQVVILEAIKEAKGEQ